MATMELLGGHDYGNHVRHRSAHRGRGHGRSCEYKELSSGLARNLVWGPSHPVEHKSCPEKHLALFPFWTHRLHILVSSVRTLTALGGGSEGIQPDCSNFGLKRHRYRALCRVGGSHTAKLQVHPRPSITYSSHLTSEGVEEFRAIGRQNMPKGWAPLFISTPRPELKDILS